MRLPVKSYLFYYKIYYIILVMVFNIGSQPNFVIFPRSYMKQEK